MELLRPIAARWAYEVKSTAFHAKRRFSSKVAVAYSRSPAASRAWLRFMYRHGAAGEPNRPRLHLVWLSVATGPPVASTRSSVSRANETSSELLKK